MSLPDYRRINIEDIKGAPSWMIPVVNSYNTFCESVVRLLNKGLVVGQNVSGMVFKASFTTSSTYTTGTWVPIRFNWAGALSIAPAACFIGAISQTTPAATVVDPVSLDWSFDNSVSPSQVVINYVAGLKNSTKYSVTFVLL